MIVTVIVACELGFWVLLGLGLVARYGLRLRRTSTALLAAVPLIDLVLLVATVLDLRGGGTATAAHGLAAAYLAFSIVFGHRTIHALDQRVAHRFAGGPPPVRPPRRGPHAVRHAWQDWGRGVVAWAIAVGLLAMAVLIIGDPGRTVELVHWIASLTVGLGAWLLAGPVRLFLRDRRSGGGDRVSPRAAPSPPPTRP